MKTVLGWFFASKAVKKNAIYFSVFAIFGLWLDRNFYIILFSVYGFIFSYYFLYFANYYYQNHYMMSQKYKDKHSLPVPDAYVYKAYTTEFDKTLHSREVNELYKPLNEELKKSIENDHSKTETEIIRLKKIQTVNFENYKKLYIMSAEFGKYKQELLNSIDSENLEDTVISFVVDHSGSMRGDAVAKVVGLLEQISHYLQLLDIKYEILGFTTLSWHGGQSRKKWLADRKPLYPGRLCDILHIIYKEADEKVEKVDFSAMLDPHVLKENVDGEALFWAHSRIKSRPEKYKLVLAISDGAPMDDSTFIANHSTILVTHKQQVINEIKEAENTRIASILIHHESPYVNIDKQVIMEFEDIKLIFSEFLRKQLKALYTPEKILP